MSVDAISKDKKDMLKLLPKVDRLLNFFPVTDLIKIYPRKIVLDAAREALAEMREAILKGSLVLGEKKAMPQLELLIHEKLKHYAQSSFRRVINATGVIIHTNLGRSPLPRAALEAIMDIGRGYSNLEYSLARGERGDRLSHIEDLLKRITGAEGALAVNNNAGAVLLALNTLSDEKEAIVSRGELVEIGGSFRIPDIIKKSGAVLVEVGTTNRTRIEDYENAITEKTSLLLKVHRSNFEVSGYTGDTSLKELVGLALSKKLLTMVDLGSGCIVDLAPINFENEPTVKEVLSEGADIVTFSGDKMFGGPQAGIILGKKELCRRLRENPMYRALRVDKFTLAALEATLRLYLDPLNAAKNIPTLRMVMEPLKAVSRRANALAKSIKPSPAGEWEVRVITEEARVGGGALPLAKIPTIAVSLYSRRTPPDELEKHLRSWSPPIIGRVAEDRVILDMRTVTGEEAREIAKAVMSLIAKGM